MKLERMLSTYEFYSGKASDLTRQLCFAAIAVVWIFKRENNGAYHIDHLLILVAFTSVLALSADFLQYVYCSLLFGLIHRHNEKQKKHKDHEFKFSPFCNWPTLILFWLKIGLTISSYAMLVIYLLRIFSLRST
jgi:hypothetical protein